MGIKVPDISRPFFPQHISSITEKMPLSPRRLPDSCVYRAVPNILMDGDRLIYALTRGGMLYPWSRMALLRIL